MAKRKDTAAKNEATPATPAPETPNIEAAAEAPKIEPPKLELPKVDSPSVDPLKAETDPIEAPVELPAASVVPFKRSRLRARRLALLAASVVLAAAIGAVVGAATTMSLSHAAPPVDTAAADQTRLLKDNIARLSGELWSVKTGIENANKTATAQFGKLADRLERAEKAQAEPATKLAKIMESLDRLEHHPQVAVAAQASASDLTGSISAVEKQQSKPTTLDGWRLRDFYAGHAVIENRVGTLYEVAAGANLPGVGKVESVKREDGRVVVTTQKGIIAGNFEQRRGSYYGPPAYRY